jgi:transcriptional regulator with XRE-family HTH domain
MTARHFAPTQMPTTNPVALLRFSLQVAELKVKIGSRIRELREERQREDPKWTQEYLARQIEPMLTGAQVSRWERGKIRPSDERLEKIAEIFDTEVADFYAGALAERKMNGTPPSPGSSSSDTLPYKAADVERAIKMEMMLEAICEHFGIDYMTPEKATKPKKPKGKK